MSLIDNIENIRKKPDYVKRRIVFASVFVIMFIIVSVWISTLRLTAVADSKREAAASSPFAVFKEIIAGSFIEVADGINRAIDNFSSENKEENKYNE